MIFLCKKCEMCHNIVEEIQNNRRKFCSKCQKKKRVDYKKKWEVEHRIEQNLYRKEYIRKFRKKNPELNKHYIINFRKRHPKYQLEFQQKHRDYVNKKNREYYWKNKEKINQKKKVKRNIVLSMQWIFELLN